MTYELIGELTLGACVPIGLAAQASIDASVAASLPSIDANLAGLITVQAGLAVNPPSIAAQLEAMAIVVANLQADMPTVSIDLGLMAAAIAELQAQLGALQAQVAFSASLTALFGTPGIYAYAYSGASGGLIPGGLPGVTESTNCNAVIFAATDAGAWSAMQAAFETGG